MVAKLSLTSVNSPGYTTKMIGDLLHNVVMHPSVGVLNLVGFLEAAERLHEYRFPWESNPTLVQHVEPHAARKDPLHSEGTVSKVHITFCCSHCKNQQTVSGSWGEHHTIPEGWCVCDIVPSFILNRGTDHVFACQQACIDALDKKYPPPIRPIWFGAP